jgi:hypothetical protein
VGEYIWSTDNDSMDLIKKKTIGLTSMLTEIVSHFDVQLLSFMTDINCLLDPNSNRAKIKQEGAIQR